MPYNLYEFNRYTLEKLDISSNDKIEFNEHQPYYYNKKGGRRKAAKMFYKLIVNNKIYPYISSRSTNVDLNKHS